MKKLWDEFKKFMVRGNVIDLAVGIIIGGAFKSIATSLVNDVLMPPIGLLLGKVNFRDLFINLSGVPYASLAEAKDAGAATINYGVFINTIITFIITALAIFVIIRQINRLQETARNKEPVVPPPSSTTKPCPYCFSDIPIKATRCPHCTSQLVAAGAA